MTIEQLAEITIELVRAWPRHNPDKNSWDEYKEYIKNGKYDSFELIQQTVEILIESIVDQLSDWVINRIYRPLAPGIRGESLLDKKQYIAYLVLNVVRKRAEDEDIELGQNRNTMNYENMCADPYKGQGLN